MSSRCGCSTASKLTSLATKATRPSLTFTRTFASGLRDTIPPESPRYVKVPEPRQGQSSEIVPPRIPGSLPVPKVIFTGPKDRKLRDSVRASREEVSLPPVPVDSPRDIKRRMTAVRRRNLLEGLSGLLDRKIAHDAHLQAKSDRHVRQTLRMRNAPERADDVLTRSTVLKSTLTQVAVKPDPQRFDRAVKSKRRTAKFFAEKSQKRRDALMALYATAADFIVTEEQLSRRVEKIFQDDFFKNQANSVSPDADNAWDVWGPPSTLGNLANAAANAGNAPEWDHTESDRSVKRQKNLAEELTGGKMSSGIKRD